MSRPRSTIARRMAAAAALGIEIGSTRLTSPPGWPDGTRERPFRLPLPLALRFGLSPLAPSGVRGPGGCGGSPPPAFAHPVE
ncbi:hypothetical protein P12x_002582 [Tundrisphaera lichenicola]|uniref:hypothetical protein n=1 Tax=Tundrisphaera lichenicola TaxID=2029860 RepID=UPI003EB99AEB